MRAVAVLARAALRRQWRAALAIALVAGLGGAFALTAATGARRAATSWERLREVTLAPDVVLQPRADTDPRLLDVMRRQPGVAAAGNFVFTPVAPEPLVPAVDGGAFIGLDRDFGYKVYRPVIEEGRRADPRRADEVTVNREMASAGVEVGQRVRLRSGFDPEQLADLGEVTVVGVHKGTFDVGVNCCGPMMLLGYEFLLAHREALTLAPEPGGLIRLTDGLAGMSRALKQVDEIWGDAAVLLPTGDDETVIVDAVNVQVIALTLLALAAGLATAVAAGQALGRLITAAQPDTATLRALGLGRRHVAAIGAAISLIVAAITTALTAGISIPASTLVPTGLAKRIEPDPGVRVDPLVTALGAALVVVLLFGVGALRAWRATRVASAARGPGARPLPRLRPSAALGLHWTIATTPRVAATAARSALVAAAVGAAGVVAVVTFAASLSHFLGTDRLYGWDFHAAYVGEPENPSRLASRVEALADEPDVTGVARGTIVRLGVGGNQMEVWALEPVKGVVHPTLLRGTAPVGADEIVLGEETTRDLGLEIGDRVGVAGENGRRRFRLVGTAVFPELGNVGDLANNALTTADALEGLGAAYVMDLVLLKGPRPAIDKLVRAARPEDMELVGSFQPPRVNNIEQVGAAPWLLAGFFSLLTLAALTHALVVSVRHRRREMAVLRSLGMRHRQLRRAVTIQSTATVVIGAAVGIPVGAAAGRLAWSVIATGLGVLNRPVVNLAAVGAVFIAGVVAAAVVALIPAALAARLRPAVLLRTE